MRSFDIAWLAGLLEGEGSFGDSKGSPTIQLQITDRDIATRAAALMSVKVRAPWQPKGKRVNGGSFCPVYSVVACGTRAIGLMMTLYSVLGERRRERVKGVLARWRASPRAPRAPRGQRFMATCHPNEVRCGHGLCERCYMRRYHQARREAKRREAAA